MTTTSQHSKARGRPRIGLDRAIVGALALACAATLAGCASTPQERVVHRQTVSDQEAARIPPTRVFFYPAAGQSAARQDRDRYECYVWASRQTGFDPNRPQPAPSAPVEVFASPPPGADTLLGAATGAVIGAILSGPRHAGEGAAVGAVAGAVIGAGSDASRQQRADQIQKRYDERESRRIAQIERKAADYRRAMAACLEGRGYTVY